MQTCVDVWMNRYTDVVVPTTGTLDGRLLATTMANLPWRTTQSILRILFLFSTASSIADINDVITVQKVRRPCPIRS